MAHMPTSILPGWLKGIIIIGISGILIGWIYVSARESTSTSTQEITTISTPPDSPPSVADKTRRNSKQLIFGNPLEQPPESTDSPAGIIRETGKVYYKDERTNSSDQKKTTPRPEGDGLGVEAPEGDGA